MDKIEIPSSKTKIILVLIGCFVFVILGFFFILKPEFFISPIVRTVLFIQIVGSVVILFFGLGGIYGCKKLLDRKIGLVIDIEGIYDNSNASSIGLIKWDDIINIKTEQVSSAKFLLVYIRNPKEYISREKGFKKKLMEANYKMYGTPLSITSNTLQCNFHELEMIIKERVK